MQEGFPLDLRQMSDKGALGGQLFSGVTGISPLAPTSARAQQDFSFGFAATEDAQKAETTGSNEHITGEPDEPVKPL